MEHFSKLNEFDRYIGEFDKNGLKANKNGIPFRRSL